MKKHFKRKSLLAAPQDEPGTAGLINKLQRQLNAMEKKLDILISQSSKRPFESPKKPFEASKKPFEKSYSQKPFRRFSHPHRRDRGKQGNDHQERTYTRVVCADCSKECEIPFKPSGGRSIYCKECFSKRKKGNLFNASRDNRPEERNFPRERHSGKRRAEKNQEPVKKKKSLFVRRKKRA